MYKIVQAKDNDGSEIRIVFNSAAIDEFRNKSTIKLLVLIIPESTLNEDDSWDEIEERLEKELNEITEGIFFSRIVRNEFSELYYYTTNDLTIEKARTINTNWVQGVILINDDKFFVFEEMNNSNYLSSDDISTIHEIPTLFEMWNENKIDLNKEFPIMFSFYSADKGATGEFIKILEQLEYIVESKTKRTLIFFKGYITQAEKNQKWNSENLSREYITLLLNAKRNSNIHEGIFARE